MNEKSKQHLTNLLLVINWFILSQFVFAFITGGYPSNPVDSILVTVLFTVAVLLVVIGGVAASMLLDGLSEWTLKRYISLRHWLGYDFVLVRNIVIEDVTYWDKDAELEHGQWIVDPVVYYGIEDGELVLERSEEENEWLDFIDRATQVPPEITELNHQLEAEIQEALERRTSQQAGDSNE